jgi:signal transduction histidine kinase
MPTTTLKPMPVATIVRTIVDSFKQLSRHKHREVKIVIHEDGESGLVRADGIKMQQLFFNLLENACDHSPENSKIVLEVAQPDEAYAVIRVVDSGAGVAPELLFKVFDPFFTTRKGGTGLGLSIVKHIVEMHGGAITLYNNTGAPGLTVEIRLPLVEDAASPPTAQCTPLAAHC